MTQALSAEPANMCRVYEQERVCHLLQGGPIPIFVIDDSHTVILWNRACTQISGLGLNGFLPKPYTLKDMTAELSHVLKGDN